MDYGLQSYQPCFTCACSHTHTCTDRFTHTGVCKHVHIHAHKKTFSHLHTEEFLNPLQGMLQKRTHHPAHGHYKPKMHVLTSTHRVHLCEYTHLVYQHMLRKRPIPWAAHLSKAPSHACNIDGACSPCLESGIGHPVKLTPQTHHI